MADNREQMISQRKRSKFAERNYNEFKDRKYNEREQALSWDLMAPNEPSRSRDQIYDQDQYESQSSAYLKNQFPERPSQMDQRYNQF